MSLWQFSSLPIGILLQGARGRHSVGLKIELGLGLNVLSQQQLLEQYNQQSMCQKIYLDGAFIYSPSCYNPDEIRLFCGTQKKVKGVQSIIIPA